MTNKKSVARASQTCQFCLVFGQEELQLGENSVGGQGLGANPQHWLRNGFGNRGTKEPETRTCQEVPGKVYSPPPTIANPNPNPKQEIARAEKVGI